MHYRPELALYFLSLGLDAVGVLFFFFSFKKYMTLSRQILPRPDVWMNCVYDPVEADPSSSPCVDELRYRAESQPEYLIYLDEYLLSKVYGPEYSS